MTWAWDLQVRREDVRLGSDIKADRLKLATTADVHSRMGGS